MHYDTVNNIVTGTLRDGTLVHCCVYISTGYGSATLNLINDPPASVSGSLLFSELVVNAPAQNVTFTFRPANGAPSVGQTIAVSPFGAFTVPNLPRQAGVLHIKPDKYLAVNVPVDLSGGNVSGINATLPAGDANNDNTVNFDDFLVLLDAFGSSASVSGSGYDASADFNGNGTVNFDDFLLLLDNFGTTGAL